MNSVHGRSGVPESPAQPLEVLSTRSVPTPDQISFWVETLRVVFARLQCDPDNPNGFFGEVETGKLGEVGFAKLSSSATRIWRTDSDTRLDVQDYYLVQLQQTGRGIVRQKGREATLLPGDFAIYDCSRPYELLFDDTGHEVQVLRLPRLALDNELARAGDLTALTIKGDSTPAALLRTMLSTLRENAWLPPGESATLIAEGIVRMVAAGLHTLDAANHPQSTALRAYHLSRIKAYALAHLREPGLTAGVVAKALNISASHLHRLFQDEPLPLVKLVWQMRLDGCGRDLKDQAHAARSISDIAFSWGFSDITHFCRVFRRRFGVSPREWRKDKTTEPRDGLPRTPWHYEDDSHVKH